MSEQPNDNYDAKGSAAEVQGNLTTHIDDNIKHITAEERAFWNDSRANDVNLVTELPEASQLRENGVYLLTGSQSNYTTGHFYKCINSNGIYEWTDCSIGNFSNIRCITSGTSVRIKFFDPNDLILDNVTLAKWSTSIIVRKIGSMPTNINDGTIVLTNTVRNQYATSAFIDTIIENVIYYYRFFSVTEDGVINDTVADGINSAYTDNITITDILDMLRSGNINDVIAAGDVITIKVKSADLASEVDNELYVSAFNKCTIMPKEFLRYSALDTASASAWKDANDNTIVFTDTYSTDLVSNANVYYDNSKTIVTGHISSVTAEAIGVLFVNSMTFEWKTVLEGSPICTGRLASAQTQDIIFTPEKYFGYNLAGEDYTTTYKFLYSLDNTLSNVSGYDRVFYRGDGLRVIKWNNNRWEMYVSNSSTHATSTLFDYQTTPSEDPWGGIWNTGNTFTKYHKYYSDSECTVEMIEGTDYNSHDTITSTVYVKNLFHIYANEQGGSNRYSKSDLLQYMNASGSNWFIGVDEFSANPSYVGNPGFMDRLPTEFKNSMVVTNQNVCKNVINMQGGTEKVFSKIFLPSNNEVGLGAVNSITEGNVFDMWASATATQRIKRNIAGNATTWWLRSPNVGNGSIVCGVNSSGSLGSLNANFAIGFAPAFTIA